MAILLDFQACRGCLAPNNNGTFTSLFENPECASRFDAIAEVSIADDKDEFAALICDSCFDEMTQAFELRRNLRFLEKISFETRRVKNDLEELFGSSIDNDSRKSDENVSDVTSRSSRSMSSKAQKEIPRLRECYVRIERIKVFGESLDQLRVSNVKSKPAEISKSLILSRTKSIPKLNVKLFEGKIDLESHNRQDKINSNKMMLKGSTQSIKCRICQKSYVSKGNLKRHIKEVHQRIKNFVCKVCGKKSGRKGHLKLHIKVVHSHIDLKCDLCDYKTSTKKDLRKHIACHSRNPNYKPRLRDTTNPNRPFKCNVKSCGKFYKTKLHLNRHRKIHTDGRSALSAKSASKTDRGCQKRKVPNGQASNLTVIADGKHVSQSSEINNNNKMLPKDSKKSFKCQICQKLFTTRSALKLHIQTVHKKLKNFVCKGCGSKFSQKGNLKRHVKAVHDKIKIFQCDLCGFKSSVKNNLRRHIARHIRNPNSKSRFWGTSNLYRPFRCSIENCGKFFKTKWEFNNHENTHSDARPFVCTICKKAFKTKGILKTHQNKVFCGEKLKLTSKS